MEIDAGDLQALEEQVFLFADSSKEITSKASALVFVKGVAIIQTLLDDDNFELMIKCLS